MPAGITLKGRLAELAPWTLFLCRGEQWSRRRLTEPALGSPRGPQGSDDPTGVAPDPSRSPARSSILNLPGESTLRRDFLRLQLANKERSEALRRQQLEQQQRENEEHKRQLLAERQKRIEEQKEQRRRLEEVRAEAVRAGPGGGRGGAWRR